MVTLAGNSCQGYFFALPNKSALWKKRAIFSSPMKKFIPLLIFTIFVFSSYAQDQDFEIGFGTSYDFFIDPPNLKNYSSSIKEPGKISTYGFDFFIGVPVGRFKLYPTFIYSFPTYISLNNLQGRYIPLGNETSVPYKEVGQGWVPTIYSKDYVTDWSDAELSQTAFGSYAMFVLIEGVEIGAGLFYRNRRLDITDYTAYDEYTWYGSTDTITDNYFYETTWVNDETTTKKVRYHSVNIPLTLNIKYDTGPIYNGITLSYWVPGDTYLSLRYTLGIRLGQY